MREPFQRPSFAADREQLEIVSQLLSLSLPSVSSLSSSLSCVSLSSSFAASDAVGAEKRVRDSSRGNITCAVGDAGKKQFVPFRRS
jgi:hypothetical protein